MNVVQDNIGLVLIAGLLVSAVATALAGKTVWRRARKLGPGSRPKIGLALSLVYFLAACLVVFVFGFLMIDMGPALVEQMRMAGEPAPELSYARVADGTLASLADHRGEVVLLNLWATWCPPCRAELPDLDQLQEIYRDRGLVVLQISDEPRETLASFLEKSPMSTEHGYVERFPWPACGRPTTFVIDREGVVRKAFLGARSFEQFERATVKYLDRKEGAV